VPSAFLEEWPAEEKKTHAIVKYIYFYQKGPFTSNANIQPQQEKELV